jgi:hypothetical protein
MLLVNVVYKCEFAGTRPTSSYGQILSSTATLFHVSTRRLTLTRHPSSNPGQLPQHVPTPPGISECVGNVSPRGPWCNWHSDWSLSECVFRYGKTRAISLQTRGYTYEQNGADHITRRVSCKENVVTYHRAQPASCMLALDLRYSDGGVPGVADAALAEEAKHSQC